MAAMARIAEKSHGGDGVILPHRRVLLSESDLMRVSDIKQHDTDILMLGTSGAALHAQKRVLIEPDGLK